MPVLYRERLSKSPGVGPILLAILPLPLLLVIVQSLVSANVIKLLAAVVSLALFWFSVWLLRIAHVLEWESQKRKWNRASRFPHRYTASLAVALGVGLVSWIILQHSIIFAVITGFLACFGVILRYGKDPQYDHQNDTKLVGVTTEELVEILDEAEANIQSIEKSAKSIGNTELKSRLRKICKKTREILAIIEEDPKDLRRARKFLKVYLQSAQKVASQYAGKPHLNTRIELETNFRNVLQTIESVIDEQKDKLLENDILDLDVKIEVLQAQLKHEGVI